VPGHCVEDVVFENIRVEFPGGEPTSEAAVAEQETEYPEFPVFHPLPCWGLFLRHVKAVAFRHCSFTTRVSDARPPVYLEDAQNTEFNHVRFNGSPAGAL
jgi:hypothetical protein